MASISITFSTLRAILVGHGSGIIIGLLVPVFGIALMLASLFAGIATFRSDRLIARTNWGVLAFFMGNLLLGVIPLPTILLQSLSILLMIIFSVFLYDTWIRAPQPNQLQKG